MIIFSGFILLLVDHDKQDVRLARGAASKNVKDPQTVTSNLAEADLRTTSVFVAFPPDEIARRRKRTVVSVTSFIKMTAERAMLL